MRPVKLLVLTAFAILAFGAVGTAVASAEETAILCFEVGCVNELKGEFLSHEGEKQTLETLGKQKLTSTDVHIVVKSCKPFGAKEEDTNLCQNQAIVFHGVEEPNKKVKCKNEGAAEGEVKALLDLHLASEKTEAGVLQPLLLAKVLGGKTGAEEVSPLEFKCSILTFKVRGTVGCLLLPGLKTIFAGEMIEILCKIKTPGDPESGTCEVLCEWLTSEPFEATNAKGVFEDAWEEIHLLGTVNKDIFIDD